MIACFVCNLLAGMPPIISVADTFLSCACRLAKVLTFAAMGFWVPQIVHCARHNARQPLRLPYVLGMSLTRLALPLYLFGCPRNVLHVGHAPALCAVLTLWMALQVRPI